MQGSLGILQRDVNREKVGLASLQKLVHFIAKRKPALLRRVLTFKQIAAVS